MSPIPWSKRIAAAEKRGGFTEEEREDAAAYHSCRLGEALGFPVDEAEACDMLHLVSKDAMEAAAAFWFAVREDRFADARAAAKRIVRGVAEDVG